MNRALLGGGTHGPAVDARSLSPSSVRSATPLGDALRAVASFKAAVNKYKDALSKAESA